MVESNRAGFLNADAFVSKLRGKSIMISSPSSSSTAIMLLLIGEFSTGGVVWAGATLLMRARPARSHLDSWVLLSSVPSSYWPPPPLGHSDPPNVDERFDGNRPELALLPLSLLDRGKSCGEPNAEYLPNMGWIGDTDVDAVVAVGPLERTGVANGDWFICMLVGNSG